MGGLLKNDAEQDMAKGDNDESELSVISLGCWASQLCHQVGIKPGPKSLRFKHSDPYRPGQRFVHFWGTKICQNKNLRVSLTFE